MSGFVSVFNAATEVVRGALGGLGGDPIAMRRAAHEFDDQAERIRKNVESTSAEVQQIWWRGPDADKCRADWDQFHRRKSQRIAGELNRLALCLRQEAAKQEAASR